MMRRAVAVIFLVSLCVALSTLVSGQPRVAPSPDRGMLGVLRRDGILVPFAAFKGSRWSMPWPADFQTRALPISLDSIDEDWWGGERPAAWRVKLAGGGDRELTLQAPAQYPGYCVPRVGIRTDYRATEPLPPVPVQPHPKDGLAVTEAIEVQPIEVVNPASPETVQLRAAMLSQFNRAEERTVSALRRNGVWRHPVSPSDREKLPVTIDAWYRSPTDDPAWTASYVEAVRAYPPGPKDDGCGLETLFAGWVFENSRQGKAKAQLEASVTYCDRVGAMYMLPFGRIQLKDQHYWVFQMSGYEAEWYQVVRVSGQAANYVVEYYGGGIRGCKVPR